ncbi:LppU/SCO3897 family protein [Streptomyces sp. NPDC001100]
MTTPPPQSPNPYAQGQQPYGDPQAQAPYPPQGQAPYPPQGGYPQQPGQPGFPPQGAAPFAPVPAQPKRRFSPKLIRLAIIIVIGIGAAIYGVISSQNDPDTAKVGDCMHRGSTSDTNPDLKVVKCSDAKAQYQVLAKISGNYSEAEAQTKCTAAAKDFQYSYTESGDGSDFLLCLKDYKK